MARKAVAIIPRVFVSLLTSLLSIAAAAGAAVRIAPDPPIRTEFRVFDGATEVTAETRLRIRPAGTAETGRILQGPGLTTELAPGIYDVQAVRQRSGEVVSVRWAERLVIMAYPDEAGRHLEVINFHGDYGALQLRWPEGQAPDPAGTAVTVTKTGETRPSPARVFSGAGYLLLVLPEATYDVRIARPGRDTLVISDVEVPANRTRMKLIQ